jgi:hypothetical protein
MPARRPAGQRTLPVSDRCRPAPTRGLKIGQRRDGVNTPPMPRVQAVYTQPVLHAKCTGFGGHCTLWRLPLGSSLLTYLVRYVTCVLPINAF